jgi:hypothetical protein
MMTANDKLVCTKGTFETSSASKQTIDFWGIEAETGTKISQAKVLDPAGEVVADPVTTFFTDTADGELAIGGQYALPAGYVGKELTFVGTVKFLKA